MATLSARSTTAVVVLLALIAGLFTQIQAQSQQETLISRDIFKQGKAQEFFNDRNVRVSADTSNTESVGSHIEKIKVDTARLTVIVVAKEDNGESKFPDPVEIFFLSDYCYNCSYYKVTEITGEHKHYNATFLVDTNWKSNVRILINSTDSVTCNHTVHEHFKERADYSLNVTVVFSDNATTCTFGELHQDTEFYRTYIPIAVAAVILILLSVIYMIVDNWWSRRTVDRYGSVERFINSDNNSTSDPGEAKGTSFSKTNDLGSTGDIVEPPPSPPRSSTRAPARERMVSVDTFRGICIVIMIFVNYKGGRYWFFHHSPWHGLTVADLVFPWFMFIMGINIVLSIDSLIRKAIPAKEIAYKIIRRTLILFFLGLCIINHNTNFANMRIPGVLQRFAVAYCIVTFLQWAFHVPVPDLVTKVVMETSDEGKRPWWYHVRDITAYWRQWIDIALFEVLWHCLTFVLPVPGCPKGYLGPGGLADDGSHFGCIGGAAAYIDRKVFGDDHIYAAPTARKVYYPPDYVDTNKIYFDPEGLLGSFHSILIVYLGLQAGKIFLYYKEPRSRIIRWLAWSVFLGAISAILTKCSQYDGWIPVNKNLWSTSFVTTLSCFAFFILSVLYYIIDVRKWYTGVPFYFVGMNSIFIYVGHEVFQGYLPFAWGAGETSTHGELLAMNMWGTACWVIIAYYCYYIKFFVKI